MFGTTSKITFAGAGVGFLGSCPANVELLLGRSSQRGIGPDKANQLRHTLFPRDEDGLHARMRRLRELLRPTFEAVHRIPTEQLAGTGLAVCVRLVGYEQLLNGT